MKRYWKAFRYRLEVWAIRGLAALIPRLPRPLAFQVGRGAGSLAAVLDQHGRKTALANLEAAFGDRFSTAERAEITRRSYQQFAGTMIDLFWSPRLNADNFRRLIEFEGFDHFEKTVGRRNPHIFACYHYGNFEMLSLGCGWAGITPHIITQEFKNAGLDPIFNHLRTRSGHTIVPRDGGIVRLYKALRRGGSVAILVDLALQLHQPTVAIDCFGLKTSVTFAHAWLAEKTGAPIVPIHAEPLPGGRCRIVIHPKLEIPAGASHQQVAQLCWDRFEPFVRQKPAPWLWMYKYWRYQPADAARAYPTYARPSPQFDALIASAPASGPAVD
jgi:KDO2-lipid IV(A) lauroyltransferase